MKDRSFRRLTFTFTFLRNLFKYLSISLLVFIILSCGGKKTIQSESLPEYSQPPSKNEKVNALLLEQAMNAPHRGDYILGPGDIVEINFFQVDKLNQTVRVSSRGFIKMPLAGEIKASGLTILELEEEISKRHQRYLQEPLVNVFIKEYRSQRITVLGAVMKPQVFTVTGQKFLLDMLSMASGLKDEAADVCYVRRGKETIIIDLNELLIKGQANLNIPVFAGDVIHIPKGGIFFMSGAVNAPGPFIIKGTLNLTQAIAMAKGFKYEAKKDQLRVYRNSGKDTMDFIEVDYDAILMQKVPDIVLKDRDVIIVPGSGTKMFFGGLVNTFRGLIRLGSVSVGAGF